MIWGDRFDYRLQGLNELSLHSTRLRNHPLEKPPDVGGLFDASSKRAWRPQAASSPYVGVSNYRVFRELVPEIPKYINCLFVLSMNQEN